MKKSRRLYLIVLALSALLIYLYQSQVTYIVFYCLILLALYSLASVFAARRLIVVEQQMDRYYVFKNEDLQYTVDITNRSIFLYPRIAFTFHNSALLDYGLDDVPETVSPKNTVFRMRLLRFPYRGVYDVGIRSVTVTDFLGLFRYTFPDRAANPVTVFPEKDEAFTLPLDHDLLNRAASNFDLFNDQYADVTDVRKHDPSDDYRRIHWKLTAKRNEFIVKNFHSSVLNKTVLLLDTRAVPLRGEEELAFYDKLCSLAASAVNFCVENRYPIELIYGHTYTDIARVELPEQLNQTFRLLAELAFSQEESIASALRRVTTADDSGYNVALFLSGIDDAVFQHIKTASDFGHHIMVYYVSAPRMPITREKQALLLRLQEHGIPVEIVRV